MAKLHLAACGVGANRPAPGCEPTGIQRFGLTIWTSLDLNATAGISASSLFIMSREGKRSIHKNRRYNGVPLGMADKTAQFERRAFLAAALGAGLALTAGIGSAMAAKKTAKRRTITPSKTQVQSRSGPLKTARTALVPFDTAPFPYHGTMPGSNALFMNVDEGGRKGHRTGSGRVYWEDQTYNDRRVLLHIPKGFDVRRPALMLVYFHGHGASLERDVLNRQKVPAQISASNANVVLVAPQLAVDAADSSAGNFWQPGAFGRFIGEAGQKLARMHGDRKSLGSFASMPIVVVAYSGGYVAAASAIERGNKGGGVWAAAGGAGGGGGGGGKVGGRSVSVFCQRLSQLDANAERQAGRHSRCP